MAQWSIQICLSHVPKQVHVTTTSKSTAQNLVTHSPVNYSTPAQRPEPDR